MKSDLVESLWKSRGVKKGNIHSFEPQLKPMRCLKLAGCLIDQPMNINTRDTRLLQFIELRRVIAWLNHNESGMRDTELELRDWQCR